MLSCSIEIPKRIPCVLAGMSDTWPLFASSTAENRGRRLGASLNIGRQSRGQVVEQEAHAARRFQVLMHHEPDLKRVLDRIRQHLDELGRTAGNIFLTAADTDARTQSGKLREVAIAAEAEDLTRQLAREVAGAAK
jgi:hypothetical protein